MKRKKILLTFLVILLGVTLLKGQERPKNLVIHLADGDNVTVAVKDVRSITFQGEDNMLLKTVTGAENSYSLDNIALITFGENNPRGIQEKHIGNVDVHFYLNAYNEIVVESKAEIRMLTVIDLTGRVMTTAHQNTINVNSLSKGVYLLKVETNQGTVTKKFVKNR